MQQAMKSEMIFKIFNTQPDVRQAYMSVLLSPHLQRPPLSAWGDWDSPWQLPQPQRSTDLPTLDLNQEGPPVILQVEKQARVGRIAWGHINTGRAEEFDTLYYTGVWTWTSGDFLCPASITAPLNQTITSALVPWLPPSSHSSHIPPLLKDTAQLPPHSEQKPKSSHKALNALPCPLPALTTSCSPCHILCSSHTDCPQTL